MQQDETTLEWDDEDDEEVEEVAAIPHFDRFTEFYKNAGQKKPLRDIPKLTKHSFLLVWRADKRALLTSTLLQAFTGLGGGAQLLIGKQALGSFLTANKVGAGTKNVVPSLIAFGIVTALIKIASALQSYQQTVLTYKTARAAMDEVLTAACAVDLAAFESPDFYDRLQRAILNSQIRPYQMISGLVGLIGTVFGFAAIALALLAIRPILVPLVVVAYIPVWIIKKRNARDEYDWVKLFTANTRERNYLQSVMTGRDEAKEVRAFNLEQTLRIRYTRLYDEYIKERTRLSAKQFRRSLGGNLATIAMTGAVMGLLAFLVLSGKMSLTAGAAAVAAMQMLSGRTEGFLGSIENLFQTSLFLEDWTSFVELPKQLAISQPTAEPPHGFSKLSVEGVSFAYPGSGRYALKDLNLNIDAGEIVALVGENGSGKTTLAKLLAGLYTPTEGRILWDDVATHECDPKELRSWVALIFQDFVRYKLPARENIAMGRHERFDDQDAVIAASRRSGAHRFIKGLPKGYETVLAKEFEEGRDLSIGQWQRIALARAFFRDAPFLILDEPTAALDPKAEKRLFDGIRSLSAGRTVLLISHRFSSVRTADRIIVLEQGQITEQGSHTELMKLGGQYCELFTLQASAYVDTDSSTVTA
ncbi:MAG: ABC transporter ATP-binding protein/permease [Actinobacteria bacterium]|nr:ABC transporter ATP-binding protein/permease [Actinomycetota bacterium]